MKAHPISGIWGAEPGRRDEYPQSYIVGSPAMSGDLVVTQIEYRETNHGDHSVGWYDIWSKDTLIASMSARHIAEIHYKLDMEGVEL